MEKIIHSNDSKLHDDSSKNIALLDSITDIGLINPKIFTKIISLDYITHKTLSKKKIQHILSDEYISESEKNNLFDYIISCHRWYENISGSKNLEFEGVNLLGIMSQLEFHQAFLSDIIKIYTIANILKLEKPKKIFISSNLKNYVEQFIDQENTDILVSNKTVREEFNAEQIRFNIFSKPITLHLSKKLYSKLKNIQENFICTIFNLWHKPDTTKLNLILEFNSALFPTLFSELKTSNYQTVLLNQRRSAAWSWKSIQILRKNQCKIINPEKFFDIDRGEFDNLKIKYNLALKKLWENDIELKKNFSKNNVQFWPIIKERLEKICKSRLESRLKSIIITKNILKRLDLNCILSLNEHGETENLFHMINHNKIPTVLLQHGFIRYDEQLFDLQWRYENESMYGIKSNYLLLWGRADFNFYSKFGIPKEKLIITGSPKHDHYIPHHNKSKQKIVLLAIMPISNVSGLCTTKTNLEYEELLEKILRTLKSIKNIKIIIKLHPGVNFSNTLLNEYLKLNHPDILVLQTKSSKGLIESSDVLIHVGPEFYEVSTIILEGMLLGKPVIDVYLDDSIKNLKPLENGLLRISGKDSFTKITDVITDSEISLKLRERIPEQLKNYISFHPHASKKVCEFLENIHQIK